MENRTAFFFDLDGTLVDSAYQHLLAWQQALEAVGIARTDWRVHRRIGMSGELFINALLRKRWKAPLPKRCRQAIGYQPSACGWPRGT